MPAQADRKMILTTPLGEDVLLLQQMTVREELGRPFEMRIIAESEDFNVSFNALLGESITVEFETYGGEPRQFNGLVSRFSQVTSSGTLARYEIIARPWLWFLTRNSDCRIFQEMTVPEIIKQVFRDRGFSDFDDRLRGEYRTWEYCVQYRETDFNFVSRLMEQEGIYYYFVHTDSTHTLVLSDSYSAHDTVSDYEEVPYFPKVEQQRRERDHVFEWSMAQQVQPGKYALDDYDFKAPTNDLFNETETARDHALSSFEIYDYPGEYYQKADGSNYAQVRNEELHAQYEQGRCAGNARGLATGALFTLKQHPRDDQNKEYLILAASHRLVSDNYVAGSGGAEDPYHIEFSIMESNQPFRSARNTPKPMVQGPQTAVVVGKAGEEIWCDEFGRVKVQFHWDRYGASDENSSCWVRVSQVWAGGKWGSMHIPRMGQEVIVDFLEGDPDQPIITGRVYNGDNMPPYDLPGSQTQSGIKSRSTKGGGADNFNEIRFEDKKGEEEMYIHAEKDQNTVVENNQTITVGYDDQDPGDRTIKVNNDQMERIEHDKTVSVGNDRHEHIEHDRFLKVDNNKEESVGVNKSIQVGASHAETIGANMQVTVGSNLTETVAVNYAETVGAAMELSVGAALAISVGAVMSEAVGGAKTQSIGGSKTESIGGSRSTTVGGALGQNVAGDKNVQVENNTVEKVGGKFEQTITKELIVNAKKIQMVAQDEISLKTGKAQIIMKKNGDITIKGKKISVKGSGDVIIKGSKIKGN